MEHTTVITKMHGICIASKVTLLVGLILFSHSSLAALSTTTAGTIKGTKPTLATTTPEDRISFSVNDVTYYSAADNNVPTLFSKDLKFNQFTTRALDDSDYDDEDGDGKKTSGAVSSTPTIPTISWKDSKGRTVAPADYGKGIGCSGYDAPFTLTIGADNVVVSSQYGDPISNDLGTLTKNYSIPVSTGLCSAKPNDMIAVPTRQWLDGSGNWQFTSNSTPSSTGGGIKSSDFIPNYGFNANIAGTKFPTTGFPKAKFQLLVSGGQSGYSFTATSNPAGAVTVDSTGVVTLNSRPIPTSDVTIKATKGTDTHSYIFRIKTWAEPKVNMMAWNYALGQCGNNENNFPTRAELTNSPIATGSLPNNNNVYPNFFTRAIGGGLNGEWGFLGPTQYPGSNWNGTDGNSHYWTKEVQVYSSPNIEQYVVHVNRGQVVHYGRNNNSYVVCITR